MIDIDRFIDEQLAEWPMAADNYRALANVQVRTVGDVKVQFNPARIVSTGAKVDAKAIKERPCFLCAANRPALQRGIPWGRYIILVNPFPIFPRHLTIPAVEHTPQTILGRVADMARLAAELPGYTVFYNGPRCGASAPDHMHFQAGNSDFLPAALPSGFGHITLEADTPEQLERDFDKAYAEIQRLAAECGAEAPEGEEAMMNVLCRCVGGRYILDIIPRRKHRPSRYGTEEGQLLVSPASVDLAGVVITPLRKDYESLTPADLDEIYAEVCLLPGKRG